MWVNLCYTAGWVWVCPSPISYLLYLFNLVSCRLSVELNLSINLSLLLPCHACQLYSHLTTNPFFVSRFLSHSPLCVFCTKHVHIYPPWMINGDLSSSFSLLNTLFVHSIHLYIFTTVFFFFRFKHPANLMMSFRLKKRYVQFLLEVVVM